MRWKKKYFIFVLIFLSVAFIFAATEGTSPSEVTIEGLRILYATFNGDTTEFSGLNETFLSNLSGAVLEKALYGRVEFNENLDIVSMAGGDWLVDFDSDLEISSNLINVDEDLLPGINKSANLSLYGITYSVPIIYHNGVVCSNCVLISYSGNVLKFLTPVFEGVYYIREGGTTCGDGVCEGSEDENNCPADCGGSPIGSSGGVGGGGISTNDTGIIYGDEEYSFFIDPTLFTVEMRKGTYYQKIVEVTNDGANDLSIGILVSDLEDFVFPEIKGFSLKAGETRSVRFDIYVSDKRAADVYIGKIIFRDVHVSREVKSILNVKEKAALFDIRTEVLKKYINPGGRVRANVSIINMGDLRHFDVKLLYKIINFDNEEYTIKEEQFAINHTYNKVFYLDVPEDIPVGDYLFYSRVLYEEGNVSASSFDTFIVEKVSFLAWIILILIILLLMYFAYRWYQNKRRIIYVIDKERKEKEKVVEDKRAELPSEVPKIELD